MIDFIASLLAPLWPYLLAAGTGLAVIFTKVRTARIKRETRKEVQTEVAAQAAQDNIATRERIDNAVKKRDPDVSAARDRLRRRNKD